MGTGAITQYVDVAQLVLYLFWIFFAGLIYYLVREGHREGYPMETENGRGVITGWPVPQPKTYLLPHGGEASYPNDKVSPQQLLAEPSHRWAGAPMVPTGNPMLVGVGPGAYADRADVPDMTFDGHVKIVPLRVAPHYDVSSKDRDPRGLPVKGDDGAVAGTVRELWLDQSEHMFRYLEVELIGGGRTVMLPMGWARIRREEVKVHSILSHQFAQVPALKNPDQITFLEEEKIMAYYGGGTLYAEPSRQEPLV
jgi:photosynthetic reaction center H subunit